MSYSEILREAERKAYKEKCKVWVWRDANTDKLCYGKFGIPSNGKTVKVYDHTGYTCERNAGAFDHWEDEVYYAMLPDKRKEFDLMWEEDEDVFLDWIRDTDEYDEYEDRDIEMLLTFHAEDGEYDVEEVE